ncbi:MAG: hypothetical protein HFH91_19635 [Lachnospiraceae bacterium]|nr:hypothetical protein [Lachnospiraceae bacterium]
MKRWLRKGCAVLGVLACMLMSGTTVRAEEEPVIKNGIYADEIDLSGMNAREATQAIEAFVEELEETRITLLAATDAEVEVTAGELGISWANPELVTEALEVGSRGNVIDRYKLLKDLERENLIFPIQLSFDAKAIREVLEEKCVQYDTESEDATLIRKDGEFQMLGGNAGFALDVSASVKEVTRFLEEEWEREDCDLPLVITQLEPKGSVEELSQVKDVLGTFTTNYGNELYRGINVENACKLVNGTVLYPGEEFSCYDAIAPLDAGNGYYPAGSYLNGRVVDSLGGGVCQVSTTLYNAVLLSELEVTERANHSMIVTYVQPAFDAAIATGVKDFKFVNNLEYPIYIEGYTENRNITFTIYGKETRPEGRELRFESKILSVNYPEADLIYEDPSQPIGYIATEGSHTGYKAQLWKIVTENGQEVSRTQVNSSSYITVPRSATVGTATEDPYAYEEIMAAIGTCDIDHVRNVIAALTGQGGE